MDMASIAGAYQGLKTAKELLTAAFEAKVDAEAKQKISQAQAQLGEVQDTLFSLREQLFALQAERDDLRSQLAAAQGWAKQFEQYELFKTSGGAVIYRFKGQPEHFACPSCVNLPQLHILQNNRTISGKYRCTGCGSEYPIEPSRHVSSQAITKRLP